MRVLWICVFIHCALGQAGFGKSYLGNSRLCHQWNCLNVKLGLSDSLPPWKRYADVMTSLLPPEWRDAITAALDTCYGNRTRKYTNTCPGQALMHCFVDNLIANCPEDKLWKEDGCAPVSSLAANKYMFSQSRYANLQKNIPSERRPTWFLQHYFSSKCCQLPEFFNSTALQECGFESFILYHMHDTQTESRLMLDREPGLSNQLRGGASHLMPLMGNERPKNVDTTKTGNFVGIEENEAINDPLDCCDLKEFITPEWREECGFRLTWERNDRLVIYDHSSNDRPTTTEPTEPAEPKKGTDVKIVPLSCEQEMCVFGKLGVVSQSGVVDKLAFSRLLDTMTASEPRWTSAKARVDTKCLSKPISTYEADCEINQILACTYDVLTENCPDSKKEDPCKHSSGLQNNITCQISSSKFRPRNRRQLCNVPDFIDRNILKECGVDKIMQLEHAPEALKVKHGWTNGGKCLEETSATTCVMQKMGVLNKYNFMDYFKTKERLRNFCQGPWYPMRWAYTGAFSSTPLYKQHCASPQKLLNVLDTMLVTCPISKRRQGANCRRMFSDLTQSLPGYDQKMSDATLEELLSRFQHVFLPGQMPHLTSHPQRTVDYPLYRFNFGLTNGMDEPIVRVIEVQPSPKPSTEKPLVLTPVYQRLQRPIGLYDHLWRTSPKK